MSQNGKQSGATKNTRLIHSKIRQLPAVCLELVGNCLSNNNNWEARMGIVLRFQSHALASAGSRAAKAMKCSGFKPAARATRVFKIRAHQSGGIELRSSHLRVRSEEVSRSEASSLVDFQSLTTSRNSEKVCDMTAILGQPVLEFKGELSYDSQKCSVDNKSMERMSEKEERAAFIRRVRVAREARFPKQKDIYELLGVDQGTWKQYESRTPLPHRLIPKFIKACQVSYEWLLTGEGRGPAMPEIPTSIEKRASKPRRAKAA